MITNLEYALMAGRAYQTNRQPAIGINFFPVPTGWTESFHVPNNPVFTPSSSGFEAVSFSRGTGANKEIVISYAGTDGLFTVDNFANFGLATGFGAAQLNDAARYYLQVRHDNPGATITFTGHSLGGGLAALMGVFFGERVVTFDQAPFAKSAELSLLHPDVAANLKSYLLLNGYSEDDLSGLSNFLQLRQIQTNGGIPNSNLVTTFRVAGEFTSSTPAFSTIGTEAPPLTHGPADWFLASFDLHAQSLLTAFIQNDQFRQVTSKLTDLLRMVFDSNLYANATSGPNENFLERLVRHQNGNAPRVAEADGMLSRFTSDLWKLAQDGGLTMTDNIPGGIFSGPPNNVSKALTAFAMQMYYEDTANATDPNKELFTEVTGGVQFDRADVSATLGDALGYTLYFQHYLDSNAFTNTERQLIQSLLPTLRDWYVQAGPGGMNVTDAQNQGAFMLGGSGADNLTGGSQTDLLVGNAGADRLTGSGGSDTLLGGAGFDTYIYNTGDGNDQIKDSDAKGMVLVNGQLMVGGIRRAGEADNTYKSSDGQYTFVHSGSTLTINGQVTIQNWQPGEFGVTLRDLSTLPTDTPPVIDYNNGLETVFYTITLPFGPNDSGRFIAQSPLKNYVVNGAIGADLITLDPVHPALYGGNGVVHAGDGSDLIYGDTNDRLFGEAGDDVIKGGRGQDVLDGGEGHDFLLADYVDAPGANDYLDGGGDADSLLGGFGDDILLGGDGDDQIFADDIAGYATRPEGRDYVDGGADDDWASGGLGDDVLLGGTGEDRLYGDNAPVSDTYVWTELPWFNGGGGDFFFQGFTFSIDPEGYPGISSATGGSDYLEGGEDDDYLQGDAGNDVLIGGTEDDTLYGDDPHLDVVTPGNDLLDGGAGNDDLLGGGGADSLFGGADNDTLVGDFLDDPFGGNDWLDGGAGNDTLWGGQGEDILFGGAGQDLLLGNEGQDMLDGGSGNDELRGGGGADVLWGGIGDDRLFGEGGNDELLGGDGNDFLSGEAGEDLLVGGAGTDTLQGGAGADTYVFNLGDGVDSIIDTPGEGNKVLLGAGISADDIGAGIGSLVLRVGVDGDAIHIQGFDPENPTAPVGIETIEFADGTTFTQADLVALGFDLMGTAGNDSLNGGETYRAIYGFDGSDFLTGGAIDNVLNGGTGNDSLFGEGGIDQFFGGTGDDQLYGGAGNDTYRFNLGDGLDSISDSIDVGEPNRVVFGSGITSSSVTLTTNFGQVLVRPGEAFEGVTVGANGSNALGFHAVDNFEFADGTTLTYAQLIARGFDIDGTDGVDILSGTSVTDRINGHGGSDSIQADAGDDTIDAGTGDDSADAGDGNDMVMGGDGNDSLSGRAGNDTLIGGEGNDTLRGGSGDDQLLGGAGDDIMYGEGGNDLVDGGTGNDRFVGAPGSYTYAFGAGSGHDIIESTLGGSYTIQMAAGVLPNDVTVGRVGQTITLNLNGGLDTLTLPSFYVNHSFQVQFSDGTVWDGTTIHNQAGDSRQVGTSDVDNLPGYKGFPDELVGLAGDDHYGVNDPGDVVVEAPNEGHDTVHSSADFTLPDNVEDLYLVEPFALYEFTSIQIGTILVYVDPAALVATGNALDNVLSGNGYDNVITGGAGDDTLYGGLAYLGGTVSTSDKDILDGGAGNDTYIYHAWSGVDTILDDSSTGDVNQVQAFSFYVDSDHLSLAVKGGALTLVFTGVDDHSAVEKTHELRIPNFDPNDAYGPHAIDLFTFTSPFTGIETTLTYSQLIDRGIDVYGTSQDDIVTGTNAPNRIHGGTGIDTLIGGLRNDIYFFDLGDGVDTIVDTAVAGAMNEIKFGTGLNLGDLEVIQETNSLTLQIGAGGDAIVLSNYDPTGQTGSSVIGSLTFANGLHLTLDELLNFPGGTNGDDTFIGTDGEDRYSAKGGNDVVAGRGGNDLLFGGSGQDILEGDAGDDQLFGGSGDDQVNGGAGADELGGGYGNDTLTGGPGSDTIDGGAGSDVYVFNLGDGQDVIHDLAESAGDNRLLFGSGITISDLELIPGGSGQVGSFVRAIGVGFNGDAIELPNFDGIPAGLRTLSFADGLTLDLFNYYFASLIQTDQNLFVGSGNNTLIGGLGNDTLHGGAESSFLIGGGGNNTLIGGSGSSIFYGAVGANNTVFFGTGSNALALPGGFGSATVHALGLPNSNTVLFGGSYDSLNPSLSFDVSTLTIHYGSDGGELHIEGFDPNDAYANPGVGTFQFIDRTLTYSELIDLGFNIWGDDAANVLTGSSAADRIKSRSGHDTLQSGPGADVLEGGQGDDLLNGGTGNDTYVFNLGDGIDTIEDVTSTGEGNRILFGIGISQNDLTFTHDELAGTLTIQVGSSGTDQLILNNFDPIGINGSMVVETLAFADGSEVSLASLLGPSITIVGTDNAEVLVGTSGNDGIDALAGDDTVYGNAGDDLVLTGAGADSVSGDNGSDTISGGSGSDYLYGGEGDDVVNGDAGNDVVVGDAGEDILHGGVGNDVLNGGAGADQLHGGEGDDTLYIDAADTVVTGGVGYDAVTVVGLGAATFNAVTAQVEFAAGSSGNDVFTAEGSLSPVTFYGGEGQDQLTGGDGNDVLVGEAGTDTLIGGIGNDVLNGGVGDDALTGATGNDTFYAGAGADQVNGGDGEDSVSGDEGADTISGGSGSDYLYGGEGDDVVNGDAGNDVVVGDAGEDVLHGGGGNDVLNGGAGADQLHGGEGDDTLYIDAADTVVTGGVGYDAVTVVGLGAVTFNAMTAQVEFAAGSSGDDVFTAEGSLSSVTFYGGDGQDQLTGGDGNDVLVGEAGTDTLIGGIGNDVLNGGAGDDVLTGAAGNDTFYAGTGADQVHGGDGEDSVSGDEGADTISGGSDGDYLYGGEGDDVVNGDEGNDVVVGEAGEDILHGGVGNDVLVGGTGNDTYLFNVGDGMDTISDNDSTSGNNDSLLFGGTINPLDVVLSRQANDLRLAIHGTSEQVRIENWYLTDANHVETIQTGNGQTLLSTQVDQLIQAMAGFTAQTGLTWDQAIDQQPQDVQAILAASWQ